jgi:hypothetical protein
VRLPTQQTSRAQTYPHALRIRMSSFAITTPSLKARTKYTKCDSSACIRAPGNSHLPKTALQHVGTCSRRRRRLGICMHAGLARPNLQALPSRCFTFLGLHFKKSDLSLFSAFCSRLSRCKTRAAGSSAGCGRPAGLFVCRAISIGTIVRFRSIYLQRGLVDVLAGLERFGRNLLPPPWGFCDDR